MAPGVDAHLALHEVAAAQAGRAGAAAVQVVGAVVRPQFHARVDVQERAQVRHRYGIPVDRPAALIIGGSWGVGDVAATARDVADTGLATPVTVCGTNALLREQLRTGGLGVALDWLVDLAPLIRACDVVVQNAGGLTSLEAMACGVPVLSYRCLPGHGHSNALALEQAGLAPWPRSATQLAGELAAALTRPSAVVAPLAVTDPAALLFALAAAHREAVPLARQHGAPFTQQPAIGQPAGQPAIGQPAGQPAIGQPAGQPAIGQPVSRRGPGEDRPAIGQPADRPAIGQPADRPANRQPAGLPAGRQREAGLPATGQPAGLPATGQPAGPPAGRQREARVEEQQEVTV